MAKDGKLENCEDGIFISDNFIAVIDGATSKGEIRWNNKSGGYFAKEIILKAISEMDKDYSAKEAIDFINTSIKKEYKELVKTLEDEVVERLQASLVIYSNYRSQIWSLGDCKYIINDKIYYNEKKIDKLLAEVRAVFLQIELLEGKSIEEINRNDTGREIILPILKKQNRLINSQSEYRFSVLDGFDIDKKDIVVKNIPNNSTIILASDGYPILEDTLEKSEEILGEIIKEDPLCIYKYKSTKGVKKGNISFDDRAYIKFIT